MSRARGFGWMVALWAATAVAVPAALAAVFLYAPEERVMGAVQKIFYFHVPAAMATYFGVAVLLAGALGFLWTRRPEWDHLARAATEIALLYCTIVLVTGPIWAKPAWGTWWTWEARITTTLILWLLLSACLMVRRYAEERELGARLASVVGLAAAVNVPIIHKAVTWWRGQHPIVFSPEAGSGLEPPMRTALLLCTVATFLLFGLLLGVRYHLAALEDRGLTLGERALGLGGEGSLR